MSLDRSDPDRKDKKPKKEKSRSTLALAWLLLYNVAMTAGWTSIFWNVINEMILGNGNYKILYHLSERQLIFFQTGAILEIFHAAVGLVPSSVILTTFQVFSRQIVLWGVIVPIVKVQINMGCAMCIFAWSMTEMIRYAYYAFALVGYMPYILNWLRYTLFIVLYPIGVSGEILSIIRALPIVKQTELYTLHMPNKWNISIEYYYCLWATFPLYVMLFPQLYFHMFKQRAKALGTKKSKTDTRRDFRDSAVKAMGRAKED